MILRDQLENVIQKRKVGEVYSWFYEHFLKCPKEVYASRSPFLVVQGPTGCGKSTTLKCIARELKISLQEYSETTDTTAINYDIANSLQEDSSEERNHIIDRRRAVKFERFVIDHLRFTTLYPVTDEPGPASADSEFESDDDFPSTLPARAPPQPKTSGVIIHIESPLSFSKSQRVLAQTLFRLAKLIKDLSRTILRRVAIVFESLECEKEAMSLPTKLKNSLGIQTIKFNPITRANMKRFIESMLKNHPNLTADKEAIEVLINDSDGNLSACLNTFEVLCNKANNVANAQTDLRSLQLSDVSQVSKRQRMNPVRLEFNPSLLRDVTKSVGFFHVLGKIFYQKRLYPERKLITNQPPRAIDRPYPTENTTEFIMTRLDVNSKNLIAWLHQHYSQFCDPNDINKAALFLDLLSDVDTVSLDATQSSQYYEMHNALDQMQSHLAIESTVFSLYQDQSRVVKSSHKKINTNKGSFIVKPSVVKLVENGGDLYSFGRPASLSIYKLVDDHRLILSHCANQIFKSNVRCNDTGKILIDYIPYMNYMSKTLSSITNKQQVNGHMETIPPMIRDGSLTNLIGHLDNLEHNNSKMEYDERHENLLDIIQEIEERSKIVTSFLDA